ncbi:MAG: alpha/beta hydrolase [Cyanobacteria bacterium]|nr:alpha/beta hydrolase [Cyanobacteriota bacterium]MDW8200160.1 alpha/beta hydrolase [Cyanobacteriota bacterium SKYGB_h_bin112]
MLFITNRVLNEGLTPMQNGVPRLPRPVSFNLSNNQAEQSVYFCRRNSKDNYTEIGSQALLTELKNANTQELLFYLHGYSNLPEPTIFPKTQELQRLFDQKSPNYVLVVPIIWPCDNDMGMVKDYFDDQITADASAFAFARLIQKFLAWRERNSTTQIPCTKRINILAHSMGNRVLRGTLARAVQYYQLGGIPFLFRNIFMVAADIVNHALEPGQEGQYIPHSARNVVVYYAADDLALRASKVANLKNAVASRRLGHTGPEKLENTPDNVYAIDCADFNSVYDRPLGHGYFASNPQGGAGLLFNHMWHCIKTGRVPTRPPTSRTAILQREFW